MALDLDARLINIENRLATLETGFSDLRENQAERDRKLLQIQGNVNSIHASMAEILTGVTIIKSIVTTGSVIIQTVKGAASVAIAIGALWTCYSAIKYGIPNIFQITGVG